MTIETEAGTPPPRTAEEYEHRAWLNYTRKDQTQAEADFKKALELNANLVDSAYGLAMTLKAAGEAERATGAFQRVIELLDEGHVKDTARAKILRALTQTQIAHLSSPADKAA